MWMRRAVLGAISFFYICIVSGQEKNYIEYAHALHDQIRARDQKTEDSLYFRNSGCIDSLLDDKQTPAELATLLHFMQARRLAAFTGHYLKFNRARYETPDLHYNYAAMSGKDLDSLILWHFASARKGMTPSLEAAGKEGTDWLSSNPADLLFKPALLDILMSEEIGYLEKRRPLPDLPEKSVGKWWSYTPDLLIAMLDSLRTNTGSNALAGYGEWLSMESTNPHARGFIEMLARNVLYQHFSGDTSIGNAYESYLLARAKDSMIEVKAYAVYQLCLLWYSKANIREGAIRNPYSFNVWIKRQSNFPDITYTPARALRLYEDNKALFVNYAGLHGILEKMKTKILSKDLQPAMEQTSIPGEPIALDVLYKNTSRIWYRIVRQNQDDTIPAKRGEMLAWLLHKREIDRDDIELPLPPDNASHRTSLKIGPLPPGEYSLLFADHPIGQRTDHLGRLLCNVSRMVILSADGRVDILDRKTGQPLAGVELQTSYTRIRKDKRKQVYMHRGVTDREGKFVLPKKEAYDIRAVMGTDTLQDEADATEDEIRDGYDPDEDTPMEYYEDKARVVVFTDRSIYRPGQRVFFKAIMLTKDIRTGTTILFNKAGLNKGLFSHRLRTWLRGEEPLLMVEDPFYRKIDSIPVRPNAYGSFSGSFRIPDHAATGEWHINPELLDEEDGSGTFHVEEYKRPRFECKVQRPEKTFSPGEPVSFTLRVRMLTGAAPGNMQIRYTIRRYGNLLLDSSGVTDDHGLLTVTARDTALLHTPITDSISWTGNYTFEATATDITGESHEVSSSLEVSSRPVRIRLRVEPACSKDHWEPLLVTTSDPNGLPLSRDLQIFVYRVDGDDKEQMIYETRVNTGTGEKLMLPVAGWEAGVYRIRARCREDGRLLGEISAEWKLFDLHTSRWAFTEPTFFYLPYNDVRPGDSLRFFAGAAFDSGYILMQLKYYSIRYKRLRTIALFRNVQHSSGIYEQQWRMPQDATGEALLTWMTIRDNKVYREQHTITINRSSDAPRIIVEQFRDRLTPGEKAHFTISVKTRDQSVAAELLSTIYDASLDLLEKHTWEIPRERPFERPETRWPRQLTEMSTDLKFGMSDASGFNQDIDDYPLQALQGRAPGLSIVNTTGYSDVVVVGYGTTRRLMTGSIINIRGSSTWPAMNKQVLIILDGVPFTGDLNSLNIRTITDGVILEGADAASLYGSRAANGVLVLSTKGKLALPRAQDDPPVKIRSRFNETAFFTPALYADKEGYYHFVFTLPGSVTEWVWKILALTRKAQFAYAERKFQTRLPLMIQPQLPRFFCQGDQVTILSRISNLDSGRISGKVSCRVEDATTGEDLSAQLIRQAPSGFSLSPHSVTSAAMVLKIPQGQLHPVRLIFKASTAEFADGEAQVLPVVSPRLLLSRNQSFSISGTGDTLLSLPALSAGDSLTGISLSPDVHPQNALINALPWLTGYAYDCAEQTFNKLLAECTAFDVFRRDTALQRTYSFWARKAVTERDTSAEAPDMPEEKTTPWESLATRGNRQTQELIDLFDTTGSRGRMETHLQRLYDLQNPDGGLAWFDGGTSNYYISGYVLGGFGRLHDQRWQFPAAVTGRLAPFLEKLLRYGDGQFLLQPDLWYAYARRSWIDKYAPSANLKAAVRELMTKEWGQAKSLRRRALRIIISTAWLDRTDPLYTKAQDDLRQLYEEAISDKQNGLRWKAIADDDDLSCSTEETLSLLAEAFQYSPQASGVRAGIIRWLLQNRADHHWTSTKATAAVIRLLGQAGMDPVGTPNRLSMVKGADTIRVSDEIMAGRQFAFMPASSLPRAVTITKMDTGAVSGHLGLYYFGSPEDAGDSGSPVHLSRSLYVYNDSARNWEPANDKTLRIGDKVRTVLTLQTTKPLHFLFIRDQLAAAMEPAAVLSGYEYEGGLSFYRSIRDTGGQFFFDFVPSGKWDVSYESRISYAGSFTGGPASLECMYKPEIHAYSQTMTLHVK